jgi:hypothetical protein
MIMAETKQPDQAATRAAGLWWIIAPGRSTPQIGEVRLRSGEWCLEFPGGYRWLDQVPDTWWLGQVPSFEESKRHREALTFLASCHPDCYCVTLTNGQKINCPGRIARTALGVKGDVT